MAEDAARRAMTPPNDIIEVKAPGFKHKKVPDFEKLHL